MLNVITLLAVLTLVAFYMGTTDVMVKEACKASGVLLLLLLIKTLSSTTKQS